MGDWKFSNRKFSLFIGEIGLSMSEWYKNKLDDKLGSNKKKYDVVY